MPRSLPVPKNLIVVLALVAVAALPMHAGPPPSGAPATRAGTTSIAVSLESFRYQDIDGDKDAFPDTGETGRLELSLRNGALRLTEVGLVLTSADPDVECIVQGRIDIPVLEPGQDFTAGTLADAGDHLAFKASDGLQTTDPGQPARVDLCLAMSAAESPNESVSLCFALPADLDVTGAGEPVLTPGPDGIRGTIRTRRPSALPPCSRSPSPSTARWGRDPAR